MQRDDLYEHYRSYYVPNNAVLALAGDFDCHSMLEKINSTYGNIRKGAEQPRHSQIDEMRTTEQIVEVDGPGQTTFMRLAYRSPKASQTDFFAFTVLDSLLSGPSSLSFFGGGGISNKTSRLYRALVERELAVGVSGGLQATIDPFVYYLTLTVHPRQTYDAALKAVDAEIQRLQDEMVTSDEVARAMKQARAQFAYSSENITNQAFWLGFAEMFDSYTWFEKYMESLDAVTPADIQRIAQSYLQTNSRVVGVYHPTGEDGEQA